MKPIDYILIGAIALTLGWIVFYLIKSKKSGKSGCGCGCATCPVAGKCKGEKKDD